ncbi:MAG: PQQ-binding-like beta-propeller repeat protein [Candidatus Bathyarchaeota archaeon]|nr:PQQ-binding-like beta-propeller repeat protein [Candidatus Bathyarchaeum sp.]
MKKENKSKIATITLILTLTIAFMAILQTSNTVGAVEYEDLLQYEWPTAYGDLSEGWYTTGGSAPSSQDVLWSSDLGTPSTAFNGMVFLSGGYAVDAFTGDPIYTFVGSTPTKIDEELFFTTGGAAFLAQSYTPGQQIFVYETATGNLLYTHDVYATVANYDPELKMYWEADAEAGGNGGSGRVRGWSWPDPSQPPTVVWEKFIQKSISVIGSPTVVDGKVMISTIECTALCLDGKTGDVLWEIPTDGFLAYKGAFYDGKWIQATFSKIYCFDIEAGEVLWTFNPGTFWNFWANMGAIYNGKVYAVNTDYHTYAVDIETGQQVWSWKSDEGIGYPANAIAAGGKVYARTGNGAYTDPDTQEPFEDEFVCLDAETGELIWKTNTNVPPFGLTTGDIIAYGNHYMPAPGGGGCICQGPAQPWSCFKANAENTGDGNRGGPEELEVKWIFDTDSAIFSSPVAAEDKIFIGSIAGTFYALDHITGDVEWEFKTGDSIKCSAAYDDGKVYFTSDDGYHYCLDADNGNEIWKTYICADTPFYHRGVVRKTSSPTIVSGRIYVGSRDFSLYCLNAANGDIIWSKPLGGLISSTPAISGTDLYVTVGGISAPYHDDTGGDDGTMYKLDTATGNLIWQTAIPYVHHVIEGFGQAVPREFHGSPVYADGMVFQSANGWATYGIDASTGEIVWTYTSPSGGMSNTITPIYLDGKVYVQDFFSLGCLNATTGEKLWAVWLAHSVHGDPTYADGKIYVASDMKVMWSVNAETGEKYDFVAWNDICLSAGCIYDNKLYWGTTGNKIYCFEQPSYGTVYTANSGTAPSAAEPMEASSSIGTEQAIETGILSEQTGSTVAPFIATETAIIIAVVVTAIVGAVSIFVLRKRK